MAHDLRLPLIRLVEGSGGGGSVKTIETTGRANVPAVDGWEWVVANMGTIPRVDRKSTRLNSSHGYISYAVFCLKKKKKQEPNTPFSIVTYQATTTTPHATLYTNS